MRDCHKDGFPVVWSFQPFSSATHWSNWPDTLGNRELYFNEDSQLIVSKSLFSVNLTLVMS